MAYAGKHQGLVTQFGISQFVDWLEEKFGFNITELLLELLTKQSEHAGLAPEMVSALNGRNLLVMLLERVGPQLLQKMATFLEGKDELFAKVAAMALREYGDEILKFILDMLRTQVGTDAFTVTAESCACSDSGHKCQ